MWSSLKKPSHLSDMQGMPSNSITGREERAGQPCRSWHLPSHPSFRRLPGARIELKGDQGDHNQKSFYGERKHLYMYRFEKGGRGFSEILCLERPASLLLKDLDVWVAKELLPFVEYLLCDNTLVI